MALKLRKEIKKSSYYVWFLGAKESKGLRGAEFVVPVIEHLEEREKDVEPFKVTLQVSHKGLKIVQNVVAPPAGGNSSSKGGGKAKSETIKHFIPHNTITCAYQRDDVIACILLLFNPITKCPLHVHAYRCDSLETAGLLKQQLQMLVDRPENQKKFAEIESRLKVERGGAGKKVDSSVGSDTGTSTTRGSDSSEDRFCNDTSRVATLYDSVAAELRAKLGKNDVPILLPPRDYDTVHRQKGNLAGIELRRCLNSNIVGQNQNAKSGSGGSRRIIESSGGSSGIGSDLPPSPESPDVPESPRFNANVDNQSTSDEEWCQNPEDSALYLMSTTRGNHPLHSHHHQVTLPRPTRPEKQPIPEPIKLEQKHQQQRPQIARYQHLQPTRLTCKSDEIATRFSATNLHESAASGQHNKPLKQNSLLVTARHLDQKATSKHAWKGKQSANAPTKQQNKPESTKYPEQRNYAEEGSRYPELQSKYRQDRFDAQLDSNRRSNNDRYSQNQEQQRTGERYYEQGRFHEYPEDYGRDRDRNNDRDRERILMETRKNLMEEEESRLKARYLEQETRFYEEELCPCRDPPIPKIRQRFVPGEPKQRQRRPEAERIGRSVLGSDRKKESQLPPPRSPSPAAEDTDTPRNRFKDAKEKFLLLEQERKSRPDHHHLHRNDSLAYQLATNRFYNDDYELELEEERQPKPAPRSLVRQSSAEEVRYRNRGDVPPLERYRNQNSHHPEKYEQKRRSMFDLIEEEHRKNSSEIAKELKRRSYMDQQQQQQQQQQHGFEHFEENTDYPCGNRKEFLLMNSKYQELPEAERYEGGAVFEYHRYGGDQTGLEGKYDPKFLKNQQQQLLQRGKNPSYRHSYAEPKLRMDKRYHHPELLHRTNSSVSNSGRVGIASVHPY